MLKISIRHQTTTAIIADDIYREALRDHSAFSVHILLLFTLLLRLGVVQYIDKELFQLFKLNRNIK